MNTIKDILDGASLTVAVGAFLKFLPALAAVMSVIWTGIRIYEYIKGKRDADE